MFVSLSHWIERTLVCKKIMFYLDLNLCWKNDHKQMTIINKKKKKDGKRWYREEWRTLLFVPIIYIRYFSHLSEDCKFSFEKKLI